jgi:hypothetical protein
MSSDQYHKHAHARSTYQWLQRVMLDRVVATETPARETITCEEAFVANSTVPQGSLQETLNVLRLLENREHVQMNQFKFVAVTDADAIEALVKEASEKKADVRVGDSLPTTETASNEQPPTEQEQVPVDRPPEGTAQGK